MRHRFSSNWFGFFALVLWLAAAFASVSAQGTAPEKLRTITITTEPGAAVWVGGVGFGKADDQGRLIARTASTGRIEVRVRSDGFAEAVKFVTGREAAISIPLSKTTDKAELAFQKAERLSTTDRAAAVAAFREAIKLRPRYAGAYLALARTHADARDYEEAMTAIRAAKRFRPTDPEVLAVEGRIFKDTGNEDNAIAAFKRAITAGKGFQPEAYTGLGMLYKDRAEAAGSAGDFADEEAQYSESAKYLTVAIQQLGGAPDAVVVYQLLGLIYEKQHKYREAIALYEQFLEVFPEAVEADAIRSFITQLRKQMAEQD